MKRISTYAMAALFAFGFAACNKDAAKGNDTPVTPSGSGNTYASLTVSQVGSLRAETNETQTDKAGRGAESTIARLNIVGAVDKAFTAAGNSIPAVKDIPEGQFARTADDSNIWQSAAFLTDAGSKNFGVVLNHVDGLPTNALVQTATFGTPATMVEDIAKVAKDGEFAMTSKVITNEIKANIQKENVADGSNLFAFDVERVVAQGIVQKDGALKEKTTDGFGKVLAAGLTYSAINGATSTYYMADKAGNRQLDGASKLYTDFESKIHALAFTDAKDNTAKQLVRLGDAQPTGGAALTNNDLGGYKAIPVATAAYNNTDDATSKGIYFLENSVASTELAKEQNQDIGYHRVAHAKVYGSFIPAKVYKVADGAVAKFEEKTGTKIWWNKQTDTSGKETYENRTISETKPAVTAGENWVEGRVVYEMKDGSSPVVEDADWGTDAKTFYLGEDKVAYASIAAAQSASYFKDKKTFQKFYTYKDGRCAYRAAWNKQINDKTGKIVNCDARRNNIYHLTIAGFNTIGMNWDPIDPKDPNLPKPEPKDPDENPTPNNPQPELTPKKGYMAVKSTVLPWNFVARKNMILG